MHRNCIRTDGNHKQYDKQRGAGYNCLSFIQLFSLCLGKFRNITGISKHFGTEKCEVKAAQHTDAQTERRYIK